LKAIKNVEEWQRALSHNSCTRGGKGIKGKLGNRAILRYEGVERIK
jgi:hypothetical protein